MFEEKLSQHNGKIFLALLIVLAVGFYSYGIYAAEVINHDGPLYVTQAEMFAKGEYSAGMKLHGNMFFYPLLMSCFNLLVNDLVLSGQLLSLLFSVATVVVVFHLSRLFMGPSQAFCSSLAFLVCPLLGEFSTQVMRDPGYLFFLSLAAFYFCKFLHVRSFQFLICGIIAAVISTLFRVEALFIIPLFLFFSLGLTFYESGMNASKAFFNKRSYVLLLLIIGFIGVFLYGQHYGVSRLDEVFDYAEKIFSRGIFSYEQALKVELKGLEASLKNGWADNDFAAIARDNIRLIYLWGLFVAFKNVMFGPFLLLAVVGIVSQLKNDTFSRGGSFLLFVAIGFFFLDYVYLLHRNFLEDRYLFAPVFCLLPWTGVGLYSLAMQVSASRIKFPACVVMVTLFLLWPLTKSLSYHHEPQELSARQMGEWISKQPQFSGRKILSNNNIVPFYAGCWANAVRHINRGGQAGYLLMEQVAVKRGCVLVTIMADKKKANQQPSLELYSMIKKIEDDKFVTYLYLSNG